ncbi:MAG: hypothetical protein NDI69_09890 [Bacteriovoracaceae bacterium]|nr:hypothetical protein [Bacteriovoracaceae bacterium]
MRPKIWSSPLIQLKRVFKTEDSRFVAIVGLKTTGISFGVTLVVYTLLYEVIRLNHAFFLAHGLVEFSEQNFFYDFVTQEAFESMTAIFAFHIFLFFIGSYVGWLILRPFKALGDYCQEVLENADEVYQVEQFSNYNLLTRFSEFFFEFLRETRKHGEIVQHSIPPQYSRIHKPVFDKIFMFHFGILLVIVSLCSCLFITDSVSSIYMSMVELATNTLRDPKTVGKFFGQQMFILNDIVWVTVILVTFSYILLGFHLYAKVSGAAFGIFATMRSFMKGNYSSRVHLLGFAYVRENTRKLNKYLDFIEKNYSKNKAKKSNL